MCYQANIQNQFEFLQRAWADNPNFPRSLVLPDSGIDPLIGQDDDPGIDPAWPARWGGSRRIRCGFGRHVTLKGGEYFFAPSLAFMLGL